MRSASRAAALAAALALSAGPAAAQGLGFSIEARAAERLEPIAAPPRGLPPRVQAPPPAGWVELPFPATRPARPVVREVPGGVAPGAWSIVSSLDGYLGCVRCGHTGNPAYAPPPYAYDGYTR